MGKTLFILAAIGALYYGLRAATNMWARRRRPLTRSDRRAFEKTVRCARCGAYLAPGLVARRAGDAVCAGGCGAQHDRARGER